MSVKVAFQSRLAQGASKYGEHAPMAAVCCNACRTCTTTNALTLASGALLAAVYGAFRFAKRLFAR
jgi:hypothetical protein